MPTSRLLIESKYAVGPAVLGFLLAVLLNHGSLMAGFGALALIAGIGWAGPTPDQQQSLPEYIPSLPAGLDGQ